MFLFLLKFTFMNIKKQLPNFITLLNLLSGTLGVFFAAQGMLVWASFCVLLGIFFDFFDGLVARLLKVQSNFGKELDSLADVVTSGVVPGIIMFQLILKSFNNSDWNVLNITKIHLEDLVQKPFLIALIGLLITAGAAYRLANFNLDSRQSHSFIGLPTPAAALVVISFPLIDAYHGTKFAKFLVTNTTLLILISFALTYLMNANIKLFSLKFKSFDFKKNGIKYLFIVITIFFLLLIKFMAIPLIILCYVMLSIIENLKKQLEE